MATASVVRLRTATLRTPSADQLITRVRAIAVDSSRVQFKYPECQEAMLARRRNMRQVLEVVKRGCAVGSPFLDQSEDWAIRLQRRVAGNRLQVVVTVKADHVVVVTVS